MRFSSKVGTAGAMLALLAAGAGAQGSGRAPVIRVYSRDGGLASNYVSPAIQVSEDAYVFAVAMDVDGQIQVLHPDFPGISVRLRSHKSVYLPNFFAGFSGSDSYSSYSSYSMAGADNYGDDVRGTVIGIASRKPFNLDRIENDGDWDMSLIRRIIERRSPEGAAQALASYLGARGEPVGRDWMRFAGGRRSYAYANYDYYNSCESAYGFAYGAPTLSFARIQAIQRILTLRRLGHQVNIVGYDFCGMPIVTYGPSGAGRLPVFRVPQRPPTGTTVFPKTRTPHGVARVPGGDAGPVAAMGAFPMTRRSEPQIGDVTVTAPTTRRGDPRQILEQLRDQNGGAGIPARGRMPIEQSQPVRETPRASRPAATGYRPEPQLDPQPVRMPDRGRSTGSPTAPVTHSSPPARAEPTHAPPPQPKTQAPPPARAEPASSSPPPTKTK